MMVATAIQQLRQELYSLIDSEAPYTEVVNKSQELDVYVAAEQQTIYDKWKGGANVGQAVTVLVITGKSRRVCDKLKSLTETEFASMKASVISAASVKG